MTEQTVDAQENCNWQTHILFRHTWAAKICVLLLLESITEFQTESLIHDSFLKFLGLQILTMGQVTIQIFDYRNSLINLSHYKMQNTPARK